MQSNSKTDSSLRTLKLLPLKRGQVGNCASLQLQPWTALSLKALLCMHQSRVARMPCLAPWHAHSVIPVPYILCRPPRASLAHVLFHLQSWACSNQPRHDVGLQLPLRRAQAGQWAGERGPKMIRCSSRLLEHSRRRQALPRWASRCLCQRLYFFLFAQTSRTYFFSRWHSYLPRRAPAGFCPWRQTCRPAKAKIKGSKASSSRHPPYYTALYLLCGTQQAALHQHDQTNKFRGEAAKQ